METEYERVISESQTPYFTRQNLEVVLGRNRRTLDYRIKALIREEKMVAIKPGFYLNTSLYKKASLPEELIRYIGCELVRESYISLEYALASYGILAESVYAITCITTKKPRVFQNGLFNFKYRNIKPSLFWGYTRRSYESFFYQMASPAKAMFDLIYLTPLKSDREIREFLFQSRFNWGVFTKTDKIKFKEIVEKSKSTKMLNILQYL